MFRAKIKHNDGKHSTMDFVFFSSFLLVCVDHILMKTLFTFSPTKMHMVFTRVFCTKHVECMCSSQEHRIFVCFACRLYHMYDKNLLKVLKKATGSDGLMALVVRRLKRHIRGY